MVTANDVKSEDDSMDIAAEISGDKLGMVRTLVEKVEKTYPSKVGENWYILSTRWYAHLKKHLEEGGGNETTNPGAVSNEDIIEIGGNGDRILKSSAVQQGDFEFVTEELWNLLVAVFGVENDNTLLVKTYLLHDEVKIEPRPLAVDCCLYPNINSTMRIVRVSRSATMPECQSILLKKFGLSAASEIRLWLFSPEGQLELPPPAEDKTVDQLDLSIHHVVIMEPVEDGVFPLDDADKKRNLELELKRLKKLIPEESVGSSQNENGEGRYNLRSNQNGSSFHSGGNSVSTSQGSGTGLMGLGNLGNTCFMNSSIQCISNVPELTQYFLSRHFENEINETNPLGKHGEIARAYADLIQQLWTNNSTVYPSRFKGALSRYSSLFNGSQQDAQESLQFIVDCLHEDLNRIPKKPYIPQEDDTGQKSDEQLSLESWEKTQKRDNSIIVDLFHGQIRSTVKCPDCPKVSVTFDTVVYYQLPLPSKQLRKMWYTYVPYQSRVGPSKHRVDLPRTASFAEFFRKASERLQIKEDYMLTVEVFADRIQKFIDREKTVDDVQDRDHIVIYELNKSIDNPEYTPVIVYLLQSDDSSRQHQQAFAPPFVLSLPVKGLSAKELYGCIFIKLQSFMDIPDDYVDTEEGGDTEENDGPAVKEENTMDLDNGEAEVKRKEDDDGMMDLLTHVPPNLFTVATCNSLGKNEIKLIKMNQKGLVTFTPNRDGNFLAVNFTKKRVAELFKKELKLPTSDSSSNWAASWAKNNAHEAVDLRDCFQLYISAEKLEETNMWRCPDCKEEKQALKKLDLWRMPKYMIVHLKRFQANKFYREKISTKVKFPLRDFDISDVIINPKEKPAVYDVVSISCHSGGLGGGHYWAVCQNQKDKQWYKFDDSHVSKVSEKDLENDATPYIILFRRRDNNNQETVKIPTAPAESMEVDQDDTS